MPNRNRQSPIPPLCHCVMRSYLHDLVLECWEEKVDNLVLLDWERVWLTKVGTPVTSSDWDDGELGDDDGGADSSGDFLGGLNTETNVASRVTDDNDGLETGTLTGTGLLLDRLDLFE